MKTLMLAIVLFTSAATAGELTIETSKPSFVWVKLSVASDGSIIITGDKISRSLKEHESANLRISAELVLPDDIKPQPENDVPSPPEIEADMPPELSALSETVLEMACSVSDSTRLGTSRGLAEVYHAMAIAAESGAIEDIDALHRGTNSYYDSQVRRLKRRSEWSGWKSEIDRIAAPRDLPEAIQQWRDIAEALRQVPRDEEY